MLYVCNTYRYEHDILGREDVILNAAWVEDLASIG